MPGCLSGSIPYKPGTQLVPVTEEAVYSTPFATLLHFKKATETPQPRVLVVAPMSGNFATLLRVLAGCRRGSGWNLKVT